ncbi:MAG TPA: carbon storage regulator [Steroidobacteraceae bacterium]|nr:carbon storage regulator [Steroidobacteraceae bacterium]
MLILTRRPRQALRIDEVVQVTVLGVGRRSVRIGISAPPEVRIRRPESQRRSTRDPQPGR